VLVDFIRPDIVTLTKLMIRNTYYKFPKIFCENPFTKLNKQVNMFVVSGRKPPQNLEKYIAIIKT